MGAFLSPPFTRCRAHSAEQATSTGQLNTILTFYEITEPPVPSALSGVPAPLLRQAIAILAKAGRAQTIAIPDGEGVRFFQGRGT
jgi:ESCRT-II complex subunit VPS25